jgi:plastocyanin
MNARRQVSDMRRHGFILFAAAALAILPGARALGAGGHGQLAAGAEKAAAGAMVQEAKTVKIDNFSFTPHTLKVAPGTTVTWVNRDDIPHTVVSTNQLFKSKALDTDDKFSYTFTKAGSYAYFCSLHPKMTGEVVVE